MKKQFLTKQVCGLSIMVAGALLPLASAQAADELSDRYQNGYLNDPYTNEVAPDTKSVMPPRGAEGPIRSDDSATEDKQMRRPMTQGQERLESGKKTYIPPNERTGTVWYGQGG
ncbi:MAG: hypothetical protein WAZ34_07655 [Rhodocyclaceae bacterium]